MVSCWLGPRDQSIEKSDTDTSLRLENYSVSDDLVDSRLTVNLPGVDKAVFDHFNHRISCPVESCDHLSSIVQYPPLIDLAVCNHCRYSQACLITYIQIVLHYTIFRHVCTAILHHTPCT